MVLTGNYLYGEEGLAIGNRESGTFAVKRCALPCPVTLKREGRGRWHHLIRELEKALPRVTACRRSRVTLPSHVRRGGDKPRYAQRRPGLPPRRHRRADLQRPGRRLRSTKAGAPTPATHTRLSPVRWEGCDPLNEGRGSHPGDTCRCCRRPVRRCSLNEGRGSHPGDTHQRITPTRRPCPAQRRPGLPPRRHAALPRSIPPRRHSTRLRRRTRSSSLNEGRGSHPGDTISGSVARRPWRLGRH